MSSLLLHTKHPNRTSVISILSHAIPGTKPPHLLRLVRVRSWRISYSSSCPGAKVYATGSNSCNSSFHTMRTGVS
jgi:hypothetical protein